MVVRLYSKLEFGGHRIIGNNAFSSVQLALDLKAGSVPGLTIIKYNYTGTQSMLKVKKVNILVGFK